MIEWEVVTSRLELRISALETFLRDVRRGLLQKPNWMEYPAEVDLVEKIDALLGQLPKCQQCGQPTMDRGVCLNCSAQEEIV